MLNPKIIEQLAHQVQSAIPKGVRDLGNSLEKQVRHLLQAQLAKLELVQREEFDMQCHVLEDVRKKLIQLEQRVSRLEAIEKARVQEQNINTA